MSFGVLRAILSAVLPASDPERAAAVRVLAALLRRTADDLTEPLARVGAHDRDDVWRGAVASRFRSELDDHHRAMRDAAERVRAAARRLDAVADQTACVAGTVQVPAP